MSSTARASRTIPRSSRGWAGGTRCWATRRRRCARCATRSGWAPCCAMRGCRIRARSPPRPTSAPAAGCASRCAVAAARACATGAAAGCPGHGRAGAHRRPGVLGRRRRQRDGRGGPRAHRAARRRARVRGPRPPVVRQPLPAAAARRRARGAPGPGARDLLAAGSGVRAARAVRRRPDLGRRARVDDRGQPAAHRVARSDRVRARRAACSTRTSRRAPARCRGSSSTPAARPARRCCSRPSPSSIGDSERWLERGVRDVPHPGERIAAGHPICTVVAADTTPEAALAGLEEQAARLLAELARGGEGRWLTRRAPGAGAPATTSRRRSPTAGSRPDADLRARRRVVRRAQRRRPAADRADRGPRGRAGRGRRRRGGDPPRGARAARLRPGADQLRGAAPGGGARRGGRGGARPRAPARRPRLSALGSSTATFGEIRDRAELVVAWRADPVTTHPRLPDRLRLESRPLVVVDDRRTATAEQADAFIELDPALDLEALWALRALVGRRPLDRDRARACRSTASSSSPSA